MKGSWGFLFCFFGFFASLGLAKEFEGRIRQVRTYQKNHLAYECSLNTSSKSLTLQVSIDRESRWMEANLGDGVRVSGYASETVDEKTRMTHYFLQGSSAPYAQQLTLLIQEGGNAAQFKRTYGGTEFSCK